MKRVFADTFYYLALLSPSDHAHETALDFTAAFDGKMITTDLVITEIADGLCAAATRKAVIPFIQALREDPAVRIVPVPRRLITRGWDLYAQRPDKEWSLTDCVSFTVMRQLRITDAATGDHHFEQAGFNILL